MSAREVCITGIGIVTSLGEGIEAHAAALADPRPNVDAERFAPCPVHPLAEPDWTSQISRRDKRQMEPWQQIGTYAAGLALDDAGLKGDEAATDTMDMIVAAGGGERDIEVDTAILEEAPQDGRDVFVAERLSNDLRPTLFLAQLSNLLAGNISIVHKVTGSSRTFMGEEGAGVSALKAAVARVAAGQSDCTLVGGSFSAEREDMQLVFELGQYLAKSHGPVRERGGLILGSMGVFLVLEPREAADARGAGVHAVLGPVKADHAAPAGRAAAIEAMLDEADLLLSGATGVAEPTRAEAEAVNARLPDTPARHFGTAFGHGVEAQFLLGTALAAIALATGTAPAPMEAGERALDRAPESVLVTGVGHWRGEGSVVVRKG